LSYPILEAMELVYWPLLFKYDTIVTWFLGKWWIAVSDPNIIRDILQAPGLAEKNLFTDLSPHALIGEYMGVNVLYSKGKEWRRHRRVINPAFHQSWPPQIFGECCMMMIKFINNSMVNQKRIIDVHSLLSGMTLDTLGKTVLGFDFGAVSNPNGPYTQAYHKAAAGVSKNLFFLFPILERLPIPSRWCEREAVRKFRALAASLIDSKRKELKLNPNDDKRKDLLTMMIQASQDTGFQPLTDAELINNTVVMFAAGHDTTANTLSYTLYHLSKNIKIQLKARNLVKNMINSNQIQIPTSEQLTQLTYLDAIILESMRLTPTLPQLRRVLQRDYILPNNTILPKDSLILLQIYAAMNHPDHWSEPNRYLPDRFLIPNPESLGPRFILNRTLTRNCFGFGGGSRICVGMSMSFLEQKVALCLLLQAYEFSLPTNSPHLNRVKTNQDPVCRPIDLKLEFTSIM